MTVLINISIGAQNPQGHVMSSEAQELTFDTFPPRIPISTNPYEYPAHLPHSRENGYISRGGRFDVTDLINHVFQYKMNPDTSNNNLVLERIDFFDLDNRYLGSFDVRANNPYQAEMFQPFVSESFAHLEESVVDRREFPDYDWKKDVQQYATSIMVGGVTPCGTQVVCYYLHALSEDRTLLGVVATFVLLDSIGKEIARFEDLEDVFVGQGILTCDQKFFCLRYGGEYTMDGGRMYNDHFRIYDVNSKEVIYELELPADRQFNAPSEKLGGWIRCNQRMSDDDQIKNGYNTTMIQMAFDLGSRLKYTSPIDARLNYVRAFTEDGFVITDPITGEFELIRYRDWTVEKF